MTSSAPHPFTLRQAQYVLAVADEGGFRRAAARCRVAQPSLSAQIAQLEDALGVRLFERSRRGVLVTPEGRELIARMRALVREADAIVETARAAGDPLAGEVSIGVIPTISPYLLPSMIEPLRARVPKLLVRWLEDKTDALIAALNEGRLDGALLALEAELGPVQHEVVAEDPFVLATPPDHPAGRGRPVTLEELRELDLLLLDEGHCLRDQALSLCSGEAVEAGYRATSLATLVQMVAQGVGVTLLPALAVPVENRAGALRLRRLAKPGASRTIALVWRKGAAREPALREIAKAAREAYRTAVRDA
ncbi:MAG TPA: LysR substrate-binding domain-containing protein [Sandaracinaceae bacterium]